MKTSSSEKARVQNLGPRTPKTMMIQMQNVARAFKDAGRGEQIEKTFGEWFDLTYLPYVNKYLRRKGFRAKTENCSDAAYPELVYPGLGVDGSDVYFALRRKFMERILLDFKFDGERVGRGAFRNYIKETVNHLLVDMLDLVPKKNNHGEVVYTDEPRRHRDGTIMVDKNGKTLYKPRMEPRFFISHEWVTNRGEVSDVKDEDAPDTMDDDVVPTCGEVKRAGGPIRASRRTDVRKFVLRLAKYAYLMTLEQKRKRERIKWRLEMIEAVFGRFENSGEVMRRMLEAGTIPSRNNFDNVKCLFYQDWYKAWWKMWCKIAKGPKVELVGGKLVHKGGKFVWNPIMDVEDIRVFVNEKRQACEDMVGNERMQELDEHYDQLLSRLVEVVEPV